MRFRMRSSSAFALLTLASLSFGQYFPAAPKNVTVVKSQLQEGVSVSFKEVPRTSMIVTGPQLTCSTPD
jgi:hypothetical protein